MHKISNILLILCLIGIIYVIYYQNIYFPRELKTCSEAALVFEKIGNLAGDFEVTNQDIVGYVKNVLACIAD